MMEPNADTSRSPQSILRPSEGLLLPATARSDRARILELKGGAAPTATGGIRESRGVPDCAGCRRRECKRPPMPDDLSSFQEATIYHLPYRLAKNGAQQYESTKEAAILAAYESAAGATPVNGLADYPTKMIVHYLEPDPPTNYHAIMHLERQFLYADIPAGATECWLATYDLYDNFYPVDWNAADGYVYAANPKWCYYLYGRKEAPANPPGEADWDFGYLMDAFPVSTLSKQNSAGDTDHESGDPPLIWMQLRGFKPGERFYMQPRTDEGCPHHLYLDGYWDLHGGIGGLTMAKQVDGSGAYNPSYFLMWR